MKLDILGEYYDVVLFSEYPLDDDGNEVCGTCDSGSKIIEVSLQEDPLHTLIHEILEGLRNEGGLDQSISEEVWEIVCQQVPKVLIKNDLIKKVF